MTLGTPIGTTIVAICAAIFIPLLILAYFLRMRRRRFEVPFSTLWSRVLADSEQQALWKHLRRWLSLLFLMFIGIGMLFAAMAPRCGDFTSAARSVVFIVDTSASMQAEDIPQGKNSPLFETRATQAKRMLIEQINDLGAGDAAMIIRLDHAPSALSVFTNDKAKLRSIAANLDTSDSLSNFEGALELAVDSLYARKNRAVIVIGDGAYPSNSETSADTSSDKRVRNLNLNGIALHYQPVGERSENVGITAFSARRYYQNRLAFEVLAQVENFGATSQKRTLAIYNGKSLMGRFDLEIPKGAKIERSFKDLPLDGNPELRAVLEQQTDDDGYMDFLPLDDVAVALLPVQKQQRVLLVSQENLYLEGAMLSFDQVSVDRILPAEYELALSSDTLPEYDATFFNDYTPQERAPGRGHAFFINPSGEFSPFSRKSILKAPAFTSIDQEHPVMRWLTLKDTNIIEARPFALTATDSALAFSIRAPLIAAKRDGVQKTVAMAFGLSETDLVVRVAFPLLLANILDWFAGDSRDLITTYASGVLSRIPVDDGLEATSATLVAPDGSSTVAALLTGESGTTAAITPTQLGLHTLRLHSDAKSKETQGAADVELTLAVNLVNASESRIAPRPALFFQGQRFSPPPASKISVSKNVARYILVALCLLLLVEWATYHRRVTL